MNVMCVYVCTQKSLVFIVHMLTSHVYIIDMKNPLFVITVVVCLYISIVVCVGLYHDSKPITAYDKMIARNDSIRELAVYAYKINTIHLKENVYRMYKDSLLRIGYMEAWATKKANVELGYEKPDEEYLSIDQD